MGHDEKGQIYRADELLLNEQTSLTAEKAGRVIVSGAKLLLDTGSAWETVTST